ncbi:MAG: DsbA family protein [Firmicutes bacterium]|nr:DsbA family protein [Bacillota bacterium]
MRNGLAANRRLRRTIVAALVLAALLAGGQWFWTGPEAAADRTQAASYYDQFPVQGTTIGNPDAPVSVEEYFDFQCPHCQTASEQVVKRLLDEYVAEGSVSFTYRFFPILGPESVMAARAGYCAADMGAFWPYQDVLFEKKGTGNRGTYSRDNLIAYARQVGLDSSEFGACLDGDASLQHVQQAYDRAIRMGLQGTPTFVVNGRVLTLTAWEDVFRAVDRALEAASKAP